MKKVLIISYFFPPVGGVVVQRVLKFVKYLPHFGWQPTVLTLKKADYRAFDPELLEEVPRQTKVIRTHTIEPSKVYHFLLSLKGRIRASRRTGRSTGKFEFDVTPKDRLDTRISNFLFIPDNRVGWLPFASLAILWRKCKGHNFDVVLSTSPPFSVHLVGLIAKLILKKPWVVDLRDLWTLHPHTKPATKIHLWISKCIEQRVLKSADKILTISESHREDLRKTYPDIAPDKFEVIPNGYDSHDFKMRNDVKPNKKFSIGHVGALNMHSGRTPYYFLMALADLKKELPKKVKDMSVFLVGDIDRPNKEFIDRMTYEFDLKDTIHCIDFVSHGRAIGYLKSFSVLLFLIVRATKGCRSARGSIPAKVYEYFATGKPILTLTEPGPTKDFINRSGCCITVDYDNTKKIKEKILECYNQFKEGRLEVKPNWDFITRFERKELTKQLADVLNQLSEGSAERKASGVSKM